MHVLESTRPFPAGMTPWRSGLRACSGRHGPFPGKTPRSDAQTLAHASEGTRPSGEDTNLWRSDLHACIRRHAPFPGRASRMHWKVHTLPRKAITHALEGTRPCPGRHQGLTLRPWRTEWKARDLPPESTERWRSELSRIPSQHLRPRVIHTRVAAQHREEADAILFRPQDKRWLRRRRRVIGWKTWPPQRLALGRGGVRVKGNAGARGSVAAAAAVASQISSAAVTLHIVENLLPSPSRGTILVLEHPQTHA